MRTGTSLGAIDDAEPTAADRRTMNDRCPPRACDPVEGRGSTESRAGSGPAAHWASSASPGSSSPGNSSPADQAAAGETAAGAAPADSLLAGRYALVTALRYGTRGGVFLGRDTADGAEVLIKQVWSPEVPGEAVGPGTGARAALRHEAGLLRRLDGSGLAPSPSRLIEQQGSLFLVQERVPGQRLDAWVAGRLTRDGRPDVAWKAAGPMALALVDLVARIHGRGLVLRSLSPSQVMVRPDGALRLIDLGPAAPRGSAGGAAGIPGYRPPEQSPVQGLRAVPADRPQGHARCDFSADLFSLGGLFFLLATGHDPLLPEDEPTSARRPVEKRLSRWLALAARHGDTARRLTPIVLGLRQDDPAQRWSLARVQETLLELAAPQRQRFRRLSPVLPRQVVAELAVELPAALPPGATDESLGASVR